MSERPTKKMGADERLKRLLAIVPWVVAQDGPTLDEICTRFDITNDELLVDLDLLFLCGVYPFTPDTLMEVDIEDGRVWIRYADYFSRPLRLTPEEGLSLVAKGATLMAATGSDPQGPLARGLGKIADVLGIEPGEAIEINLGKASQETLELLRESVTRHQQVEIDYYTYGRDVRTRRVIEPHLVFLAEGEWYVNAWCTLAQAQRRFRIDRIRSISLLDRCFEAPEHLPEHLDDPTVFHADEHVPRTVIELTAAARWIIDQYPLDKIVELKNGNLEVTIAVSERAWLERLLVRLGSNARVVDGDTSLAREAAKRILKRYKGSAL